MGEEMHIYLLFVSRFVFNIYFLPLFGEGEGET